jgi:hypothetical protein
MKPEEQAAVAAVMNFLESYAGRSVEGCMSVIAASTPILLFGTNDNEVFKTTEEVRAAFTKDFAGMTNISWGKRRNIYVQSAPTLASVIVELAISYQHGGKDVETLIRYALTLTKEGEQWKICSGTASVPLAAETYAFPQ